MRADFFHSTVAEAFFKPHFPFSIAVQWWSVKKTQHVPFFCRRSIEVTLAVSGGKKLLESPRIKTAILFVPQKDGQFVDDAKSTPCFCLLHPIHSENSGPLLIDILGVVTHKTVYVYFHQVAPILLQQVKNPIFMESHWGYFGDYEKNPVWESFSQINLPQETSKARIPAKNPLVNFAVNGHSGREPFRSKWAASNYLQLC